MISRSTSNKELIRSKRGGWREPWEKLAQSFFDLHEKYPRWRNRPAALFRSALAMEELAKRSMLRQDAQAAVDRYGVFLKSYASHVLADDALFGIARIKAERFNDFSGAQEALSTIQNQYPRGDVAPEAKLYAQRLKAALEAAKSSTPGKKTASGSPGFSCGRKTPSSVMTAETGTSFHSAGSASSRNAARISPTVQQSTRARKRS